MGSVIGGVALGEEGMAQPQVKSVDDRDQMLVRRWVDLRSVQWR